MCDVMPLELVQVRVIAFCCVVQVGLEDGCGLREVSVMRRPGVPSLQSGFVL